MFIVVIVGFIVVINVVVVLVLTVHVHVQVPMFACHVPVMAVLAESNILLDLLNDCKQVGQRENLDICQRNQLVLQTEAISGAVWNPLLCAEFGTPLQFQVS